MKLPTHIYIGSDKCGSSWIAKLLDCHNDCFVPQAKDIYYFDRFYERGLHWYANFYAPAQTDVRVEICHDYILSSICANRINNDLPGSKVFCSLRDPVDRAFSHYLYLLRSGMFKGTFSEAINTYPEIRDNGLYGKLLRQYFEVFDHARIGVFFFDELMVDPLSFARGICSYLGISEPIIIPNRERGASAPRNWFIARMVKKSAILARQMGFANLVGRLKSSRLQYFIYKEYDKSIKPKISDIDRSLLNAFYQDDYINLRSLLSSYNITWRGWD